MIEGNWGYVAFGYLVSAAVLGTYCARLAIGLRRARAIDAGARGSVEVETAVERGATAP